MYIDDQFLNLLLPSVEGGFALPYDHGSGADPTEIALLAQLVYAEARGEPFDGQIAVAAVVLNRVVHPDFPDSIRAVIFQKGQFESVANKTVYNTPDNLAYAAVLEALRGLDPTSGALFFWNPGKVAASSWVWTRTVKTRLGQHVFA